MALTLFSCKSKEMVNNTKKSNLTFQNNIIENKSYNQDKTMLLVTSYKGDMQPRRTINYKVLNSKSKKILKEGIFIGMKLEWFALNQLKGYLYIGMTQKESDEVLQNKNILIIEIK
tara:strand:+ start:5396 stop:5743 length:348 start_codon:yes stop_codon:yes gene_type:complete